MKGGACLAPVRCEKMVQKQAVWLTECMFSGATYNGLLKRRKTVILEGWVRPLKGLDCVKLDATNLLRTMVRVRTVVDFCSKHETRRSEKNYEPSVSLSRTGTPFLLDLRKEPGVPTISHISTKSPKVQFA